MIKTTVKFSGVNLGGLGLGSGSLFRKVQMQRLGEFALKTVIERTKKGVGSDDSPMPALSQKYSAVKSKGKFVRQRVPYALWKAEHGLQPFRDLSGTGKQGGHMLDNPSVRLATESSVKMAFTSRTARMKAVANEKRTPFFSFSDADEKKIREYAEQLFHAQVEVIRQAIAQRRKAA